MRRLTWILLLPACGATLEPPPGPDAALTRCNPCVVNDEAAGAIDVTSGGTFTADMLASKDDVSSSSCGAAGGRDVFYRITLTAPRVYYIDTFGSSFDTTVHVFDMPCSQVGASAVAVCYDNACGVPQSQLARSLPAGESCIVVDQASASDSGALTLNVVRADRDGQPLAAGPQTIAGDTCSASNITEPLDQNCDGPGANGKEHAYYFTACPGAPLLLDADLCPAPAWDSVLYVKRVDGNQIGCNDDTCALGPTITNVPINGSLFFLYVDGFDATACGAYSLDTNLR